jgi:hypothetical protein
MPREYVHNRDMNIRSILYITAFFLLLTLTAQAQQPPISNPPAATSADAQFGTVVVFNISDHKTGKLKLRDGKNTIANIGQRQWSEVKVAVGEHVISAQAGSQKIVIRVKAGETLYFTLDFHVMSYLPPVGKIDLQQVSQMEGDHWKRELGEAKRVVGPQLDLTRSQSPTS